MALKFNYSASLVLPDGTDISSANTVVPVQIGTKGLKYNQIATTADATLNLGSLANIGLVILENREALVLVTTPSTPTVTPQGAAGSTAYSYKVVAKQTDGSYSAASAAGTTSTGNATLTGSNFNKITWPAVNGANSYDVYRTASAGTPGSTGLIGNTVSTTFNDTGLAGDSSTAPATGVDNTLLVGEGSGTYPLILAGKDVQYFRWNYGSFAAIHFKSNTIAALRFSVTLLEK